MNLMKEQQAHSACCTWENTEWRKATKIRKPGNENEPRRKEEARSVNTLMPITKSLALYSICAM